MNFPHMDLQRPSRPAERLLVSPLVAFAAIAAAVALPQVVAIAQDAVPVAEPAPGRVVYSREEQTAFDLWLSDPDGGNETRLTTIDISAAGEDYPRWSPDGQHVLFETTRATDAMVALHLVPFTGGESTILIEEVGLRGGEPSWHPEDDCFAFAGSASPGSFDTDLKLYCLDKGEVVPLSQTVEEDERMPDWHPSGEHLVFISRPSGAGGNNALWTLWRMNADGSDRRLLLALPDRSVRFPRWSPDGERIAFIAANRDFDFGTMSMFNPESGAVSPLADRPSGPFAWSPDGNSLLFNNISDAGVAVHGATSNAGAFPAALVQVQAKGLYRLRLDDLHLSRLDGKAGGAEARRYDFGYAPDWSPGTATPAPTATLTPRPSATPTASPSPSPSVTPGGNDRLYLPRLHYDIEPTPTVTPEPSESAPTPMTPTRTAPTPMPTPEETPEKSA